MLLSPTITLEILSAPSPVFIQDGGRAGYMHHGIPAGGALVPELLAAANRAAGNPWNAPALELYGEVTLALHGGPAWVALDETAWQADADQIFTVKVTDSRYVSYLAVQGGIDVPEVLGGCGTLVSAALGGFEGRALRRGDMLTIGQLPARPRQSCKNLLQDMKTPIRLIPGPDPARFDHRAYSILFNESFTVSAARNRVGMRLSGPRIKRRDDDTAISTPMARGALQVPSSGELIVLGPDHPTTGGYPVIATLIRADWGRISVCQSSTAIRFQAVTLAEARALWCAHAARYFQ